MKLLNYRNNWEIDLYDVDGKSIANLTKVVINSKVYEVTAQEVSVPYREMGFTSHGTSIHYFVTEKVFGDEEKRFDLNSIRSPIYALEYTLCKK